MSDSGDPMQDEARDRERWEEFHVLAPLVVAGGEANTATLVAYSRALVDELQCHRRRVWSGRLLRPTPETARVGL